jgi:hypothetical protein
MHDMHTYTRIEIFGTYATYALMRHFNTLYAIIV